MIYKESNNNSIFRFWLRVFIIKAHEPPANPEIHFEPIVSLPKVEIKSLEENEEEIFQM